MTTQYLHLKDYFATYGGGVNMDCTAAAQAWINDCKAQQLTGWVDSTGPGGGSYWLYNEITWTDTFPLSIEGPGFYNNGAFTMMTPGQNGFHFSGSGRLFLSGFGIKSGVTPTGGSAFLFDGVTAGGNFENLDTANVYIAFNCQNTVNGFSMQNCDWNADVLCAQLHDPGDSEIHNCRFSSTKSSAGCISVTGDAGGLRILSNKFNTGYSYLYAISIAATVSDGDLFIIGNSIEGYNAYGLLITQTGSDLFGTIIIDANEFSGAGIGIALLPSTPNWLTRLIITSNIVASSGILVNAATLFTIGNNISDTLIVGANSVRGTITGNVFNPGGLTNLCTTAIVANNQS